MTRQTIPSISSGLVELESGAVFELDSLKGNNWLESVTSFRFIPTDSNKPYTARKESGKGGDYWYGYRKEAGKLHKRYIGKTADLTTAKLEEIAQNLNTPPEPRQLKVTYKVTYKVTDERISALEEQIKILQESVQSLQDILPGKSQTSSNSRGLLKEEAEVTEIGLQNKLGNLTKENQLLKQELKAANRKLAEWDVELNQLHERNGDLGLKVQMLEEELKEARRDRAEVEAELSDLKQNSKIDAPRKIFPDFPEASDLLNQLKGMRRKSKADLLDVESVLEILGAEA